jgi:hypothetical protein
MPFVTIDSDNAIIRFYAAEALKVMTEDAVKQLLSDLTTLAKCLMFVHNAPYQLWPVW